MKDWSGNSTAVYVTNGDSSHSERDREERDYYATDPKATEALLQREIFCKNILEPACGGGHISKVLEKHGYSVDSRDIIRRDYNAQSMTQDFLTSKEKWCGDIITNPPYKYAAEFATHALEVIEDGHKVAMFLKLTFLEGEKRRELFQFTPPILFMFSQSA